MSEELKTFTASPYNKYPGNKQALPIVARTIDRLNSRIDALEGSLNLDRSRLDCSESILEQEIEEPTEKQRLNADALDKLVRELNHMNDVEATIDESLNEPEEEEDDNMTVRTEDFTRERDKLMQEPQVIIGKWCAKDLQCDNCIKTQIKVAKRDQKQKAKENKQAKKTLLKKQKELIEAERKLLKKKLKDLEKGKNKDYGIEQAHNEKLRNELKKLSEGSDDKSHFNINLII